MAKFDVYCEKNLGHLSEQSFRKEVIYIQNVSAISFFLLVHIPLSRISSLFCFVTVFVVWMLDNKTKLIVYDYVNLGMHDYDDRIYIP